MERLTKNRTTIIIAHRMSTVVKAERVVVLDQGRTVQQGSYRELRRAADTSYDRLCRSAVDVDEGRETPYLSLLAQEGVKK